MGQLRWIENSVNSFPDGAHEMKYQYLEGFMKQKLV